MYYREFPISPSQDAVNGSLCIYVGAGKRLDARQQLIGLSVLRHATEQQLHVAMQFVEVSQRISQVDVQAMLVHGCERPNAAGVI